MNILLAASISSFPDWPWIILFFGLCALAGLLVYLYRKKRPTLPEQTAVTPTPAVPVIYSYLEYQGRAGGAQQLVLDKLSQTIGRASDNDLIIDDRYPNWESVSRYHATIKYEHKHWILYDIGQDGQASHNGIYVEGRRTKKNVLHTGWQVTLGAMNLIFYEAKDPFDE